MLYSILGIVLLISFITDVRKRRILNIVTFPAMGIGLFYYTLTLGWKGFLFSGAGLLVGFALLLIPYLLGGMGAGDVKLLAAIGALTGTSFVLHSFFYTALIGGVIGLILIMKRMEFWKFFKSPTYTLYSLMNLKGYKFNKESKLTYPYGVAITFGTLCAAFVGGIT